MKYINDTSKDVDIPVSNSFYKKYWRASASCDKAKKDFQKLNGRRTNSREINKLRKASNKAEVKFKNYQTQLEAFRIKAEQQPVLQKAEAREGASLKEGKFTKAAKGIDNAALTFFSVVVIAEVAAVAIVLTGGVVIPFAVALALYVASGVAIPVSLIGIREVFKKKKSKRETELSIKEEIYKNNLDEKDAQIAKLQQAISNSRNEGFAYERNDLNAANQQEKEEISADNPIKSNIYGSILKVQPQYPAVECPPKLISYELQKKSPKERKTVIGDYPFDELDSENTLKRKPKSKALRADRKQKRKELIEKRPYSTKSNEVEGVVDSKKVLRGNRKYAEVQAEQKQDDSDQKKPETYYRTHFFNQPITDHLSNAVSHIYEELYSTEVPEIYPSDEEEEALEKTRLVVDQDADTVLFSNSTKTEGDANKVSSDFSNFALSAGSLKEKTPLDHNKKKEKKRALGY